jgi:hypothetical protein
MKKIIILFLMLFILSGCEGTITYVDSGITLDGNSVYYYETDTEICITLYSTTIELSEDLYYEVIYNCNIHKVVLLDNEYIPLTTYIKENLISHKDLLNSRLGTPIYYDSIMTILGIDLNDFSIDRIIIRTLDGEFNDDGGMWNESVELAFQPDEIRNHVLTLLSEKVLENSICDNSLCVIYGNISPGSIYLKSGDDILTINFYGNRYDVFYNVGDTTTRLYGIDITPENESLMETIMEIYNSLD